MDVTIDDQTYTFIGGSTEITSGTRDTYAGQHRTKSEETLY